MTIAERKAREEYDQSNPWREIATADKDLLIKEGSICELRRTLMGEPVDFGSARFFFHTDGRWYRLSPPDVLGTYEPIVEYRTTGATVSAARRERIARGVATGQFDKFEYHNGWLRRKPKRYALYWRAPQ